MYKFEKQIERQQEYYNAFVDWLKGEPAIVDVEQGTEKDDRRGIDLWAYTADTMGSLQVKVDFWAHQTGNLIFEVISQARHKTGSLGWGFTTEADYLAFVVAETGDIYIFRTQKYVEWAIENYARLENFSAENQGYKTLGCKIPLTELLPVCFLQSNLDDRNTLLL